jgi:hypothetical protein
VAQDVEGEAASLLSACGEWQVADSQVAGEQARQAIQDGAASQSNFIGADENETSGKRGVVLVLVLAVGNETKRDEPEANR